MLDDPWYQDYINQHSLQDATKLNGAYGQAPGLHILPKSVESDSVDVQATPLNADTGENSSL